MQGRRRLHGAFAIDIGLIEPDPNQPRKKIDPVHLDELTKSIKRHGILQPISVRYIEETGRYRIVAGECRYTAANQAGLTELPCWLKTPKENEILVEQIVENWVRSDLNPFDLADSLAILRDANGYTQRQIAEETGKSTGEISKLLTILDLDPDVQKTVRDDTSGRITKRHLYSVARLPVPQQTILIDRIQRNELSAIDTEKLVGRMLEKRDTPKKGGAPVSRRRYVTRYATVQFIYRKQHVTDADLLNTLKEVQKQILEQAGDPVDHC